MKMLRRGQLLKLTKDINCIPAGIYKFYAADEGFLELTVSKKIRVYITQDVVPYLEPLHLSETFSMPRINQTDFLDRYYTLLHTRGIKEYVPGEPLTMCIIDPSVMQDAH